MTARRVLLLGLGAVLGLGVGGLAGLGLGSLLQPSRMEAGPWSAPVGSPTGSQGARTRSVSFTGSPRLPEQAWQVDLTDQTTGQHLILELPGPPGQVEWESDQVLVVRGAAPSIALEWSGH